jgi:hypothetical protein
LATPKPVAIRAARRAQSDDKLEKSMTETKRRTADDVLYAVAELLVEYRDQKLADAAALEEQSVAVAAVPGQTALPQQEPGEHRLLQADIDATSPTEVAALDTEIPAPWGEYIDPDPTKKKSTSLIMSPTLYAKMQWVTNNVPKMSLQKLIQAGTEAEADRLIALHHKRG